MSRATKRRFTRPFMLTLIIDPTAPDSFTLGFVTERQVIFEQVPLPSGHHERVRPSILAGLLLIQSTLRDVRRVIVVAGPGRFSNLRVAATIANTLKTAVGCSIFSARPPRAAPDHEADYLNEIVRNATATTLVRPRYGKPPSITKPKTIRK